MVGTTNNIYVSSAAQGRENLARGLEVGTWGIKEASVDEKLHITGDTRTGRAVLEALQEGDAVLFATGGPPPRVPSGGWGDAVFGRAILCRVARPYYTNTAQIWDDDVYEHRFDFEVINDAENVEVALLGAANAEALRVSANSRGVPVDVEVAVPFASMLEEAQAGDEAITFEPGDDLDVLTLALARREQRQLRIHLLGSATSGVCAICAKEVDRDQLRVAHIKRRSEATDDERRNVANVMLACLLGCDSLFEHGYILVDGQGVVVRNSDRTSTSDVQKAVAAVTGAVCSAFTSESAPYFAWHRDHLPAAAA